MREPTFARLALRGPLSTLKLISSVAGSITIGCSPEVPGTVELEELWATSLPTELGVPTGLFLSGDTALLWYQNESVVAVATPDEVVHFGLPGTQPITARTHGGAIHVVETTPPALVVMSFDGDELEREPLPLDDRPHSATFLGSVLYLVFRSERGGTVWGYHRSDRDLRKVTDVPGVTHVSASEGRLLLSSLTSPFAIRLVDPATGRVIRTHRPSAAMIDSLETQRPGRWVGLRAVNLGRDGVAQTLSDLTSDRRLLLRYVPGMSSPYSVASVDIPMSLVAAAGNRRVGGIRSLNQPEVVVYGW